jgi:protein SCO1/2
VSLQRKLAPDQEKVQLVSISIDPEYDTPEVMTEYLEKYQAKPGWMFLTGTRKDIDKVMRAFDAYVPNKMAHYPITFLHAPSADRWVRIYGLIGTSDLMKEYQGLVGR